MLTFYAISLYMWFFKQPTVEKRVHFSSPTTTAAVSSSTATKIDEVKSKREMKNEFRQNVAEIYCQRLKYYYRIKKITCHVSSFVVCIYKAVQWDYSPLMICIVYLKTMIEDLMSP